MPPPPLATPLLKDACDVSRKRCSNFDNLVDAEKKIIEGIATNPVTEQLSVLVNNPRVILTSAFYFGPGTYHSKFGQIRDSTLSPN